MKRLMLVLSFLVVFPAGAISSPCNCELIYDEFDSLMNKNFLLKPEKYLPTQKDKLSRQDYENRQKGLFVLDPSRRGLGIAVIHTNRNTRGKLLFSWRKGSNGQPLLSIRKLVLYGRVLDGYRPREYSDITIRSSYMLDADTGTLRNPGKKADIWFHNVDGKTMFIEAVNGAKLEFPMASLCAPTDKRAPVKPKSLRQDRSTPTIKPYPVQIDPRVLEKLRQHESQTGCPTEKRVLPDGTVEIRYPDGRIERRSENVTTIIYPDGRKEEVPRSSGSYVFKMNVPFAGIPSAPSTEEEALWLGRHAFDLLEIIGSILKDENALAQYEEYEGENISVFEAIEIRRRTIDYLVSP